MVISVGIDVSKDKHDCFIVSSEGEVLADVFSLDAYVDKDPWTGRPMCVTYRIKPVYSKN